MFWEDMGPVALQTIILLVMLVGLIGLAIPVLPGLVIIWVAALVYGLITGFTWVNGAILAVMTVLMIGGSLVDNVIMGASARQKGASWLAIGVALALGLAGSLIMPPFGGLVAALIGLFAVEYYRLKDVDKAIESTKSMAIGCGWAAVIRFSIGLLMIGMWAIWVLTT
jgi:uncharacterized protein YqgC (DUF456 family)